MIAVFDIGNTNVKIGLFDGDELKCTLRMASGANTGDEYWLTIKNLMQTKNYDPKDVHGAIISSVNPNMTYTFEHLVREYFGVNPLMVGAGIKTGINVKYDNPKEVGADRIANSVAAYKIYGGPCIVLDCGTATTFNVIDKDGVFLGGAISFGLKSAGEALSSSAARLPKVDLTAPSKAIGKSTITNMQSGIIFGFVGMVEYIIKKLKAESDPVAKVIATGGISDIIRKNSNIIDVFDRHLTLKGLNYIYKLNT